MGVRGLYTYLTQQPDTFTPYELHNTYLVFDAENYVANSYRQLGLARQYGGEYLEFTVRIRAALKQFRKCRITPIFVFDGCHESTGSKRETLMKRNTERIGTLSQFLNGLSFNDADATQNAVPDILPKLTNQVFISVLDELSIHHVKCEREADMHVAELALYLDCPVVSNDSDFYIFGAPPSADYRVIPLMFLEQECKPLSSRCNSCTTNGSCYALSCKVFRPSKSILGKIHPPLIPLLPVLVGNDVISSMPFPSGITSRVNSSQTLGLSYTGRRIHAVIDWLGSFSQDVSTPIREILSLHQGKQLSEITSQIIGCVRGYVLDLHTVCRQLADFLSLRVDKPEVETCSKPSPPTTNVSNYSTLSDAITALTLALPSDQYIHAPVDPNTELLRDWPTTFVRHFRQGSVSTTILDALFVHSGTVMRILLEDLRLTNAIYLVTERIRYLEYGLLIHLEHQLGCSHKLGGSSRGNPVENRRHDFKMSYFELRASPISFPPIEPLTPDSICVFLRHHLQLDLHHVKIDSTESLTLVCVLVLWFRHSQLARYRSSGLRDCSVALGFISCTLLTSAYFTSIQGDECAVERTAADLSERFQTLSNNLKWQYSRFQPPRLSIEVIHQLNELQLVYQEFQQLMGLLDILYVHSDESARGTDTLSAPSSQFLSFIPEWMVFSSGRLLHWLVLNIEHSAPRDRMHQTSSQWISWILNGLPKAMNVDVKALSTRVCNLIFSAERMLSV